MDWIKLILSFLQACAWPIAVVGLLVYFGPALKEFIKDKSLTIKAGDKEITIQKLEAIHYLSSASTTEVIEAESNQAIQEEKPAANPQEIRKIATFVEQEITPKSLQQLRDVQVLWVDDIPKNNENTVKAFEALGIQCAICKTTEEALTLVSSRDYDVIISDMSRFGQPREGFRLFDELRKSGIKTPFILHSRLGAEKRAEASKKGIPYISDPTKLLQEVVKITLK